MTDSEKELIKLGAKTTPPLAKDYLGIALYAGSKNGNYVWEIHAQVDEEGAGDVVLLETEYYDVAQLALPIIKAKYMGN